MFSGIVQTVGRISGVQRVAAGRRLRVEVRLAGGRPRAGESVSVDGVCLTVERGLARGFVATVVPETLRLTTLGQVGRGARVNLERALMFGDPVGGHLVQGHVDGVGRVRSWSGSAGERRLRIAAPRVVQRDLVYKGSVAVSGVSLTVAGVGPDSFVVALVPHTLEATTLGRLRPSDLVNLEIDIFARYVRNLLSPHGEKVRRRTRRTRGR
jgi:riboflavin synthase alpha subunit